MNVINNAEPKVSVIIPTFKRADMLQTTIDILIGQLYKNIEMALQFLGNFDKRKS